jgi:hypothetical protein
MPFAIAWANFLPPGGWSPATVVPTPNPIPPGGTGVLHTCYYGIARTALFYSLGPRRVGGAVLLAGGHLSDSARLHTRSRHAGYLQAGIACPVLSHRRRHAADGDG